MASNFPTSLDSYTTLVDNVDDVLAAHANDRGDAIEALEAKLGVTSSSVNSTVDYFLKHASGAYRVHVHDGGSDDGAAIPGSSLTTLSTITALAGIIPVANIDVGTTANKILQLNGSAQIPAVSGALLTNLNATNLASGTVPSGVLTDGSILQTIYKENSAAIQDTVHITHDTSVPLITEGTEIFSQAIVMGSATNKVRIQAMINVSSSASDYMCFTVWVGTVLVGVSAIVAHNAIVSLDMIYVPGSAASYTVSIRMGADSQTMTLNRYTDGTTNYYGGEVVSTLTLSEIKAS